MPGAGTAYSTSSHTEIFGTPAFPATHYQTYQRWKGWPVLFKSEIWKNLFNTFKCRALEIFYIFQTDAGKPCAFPFVYRDCTLQDPLYPGVSSLCSTLEQSLGQNVTRNYSSCTNYSVDDNWCYTRLHQNGSGMVGFWGECRPQCTGEMPRTNSQHNLANDEFADLWITRVYDLKTWGSGICHTYNPPNSSPPGSAGLLYALIGDINVFKETFRSVTIYLHHSDNFWPGIWAAEKIPLALKENVDVSFEIRLGIYLSKAKSPCTDAVNYSLTDCLLAYVERTAGCKLDWFVKEKDLLSGNYCDGPEDILRYKRTLETIDFSDRIRTQQNTG